jgi:hypothetical protein
MEMRQRSLCLALTAAALGLAAPAGADDALALKVGSWVCGTLEAYQQASNGGWTGPTFSLQKFREHKQEQAACLHVDDDLLEDMMPPFVTVLGREGDYAKVSFIVEYYKRIDALSSRFNRVQFTGWTAFAHVEPWVP